MLFVLTVVAVTGCLSVLCVVRFGCELCVCVVKGVGSVRRIISF